MPIYKINYTEVWSNDFHVEARSKEEADAVFTTAIDRDIIRPGDDCYFESSTWTTEEVPDSHAPYIDVSYRDFEGSELEQTVAALCADPDFQVIGIASLSRGVTDDYARTIWERIKLSVAEDVLACTTIEEYSDSDVRLAIGRVMMKQLKIEQ